MFLIPGCIMLCILLLAIEVIWPFWFLKHQKSILNISIGYYSNMQNQDIFVFWPNDGWAGCVGTVVLIAV